MDKAVAVKKKKPINKPHSLLTYAKQMFYLVCMFNMPDIGVHDVIITSAIFSYCLLHYTHTSAKASSF